MNTDFAMAQFLADHGMLPGEAVRRARAACNAAPDPEAADTLAWALYKSGRSLDALAYAEGAIRQALGDPTYAGMIFAALGDHEEAREHLELALEILGGVVSEREIAGDLV